MQGLHEQTLERLDRGVDLLSAAWLANMRPAEEHLWHATPHVLLFIAASAMQQFTLALNLPMGGVLREQQEPRCEGISAAMCKVQCQPFSPFVTILLSCLIHWKGFIHLFPVFSVGAELPFPLTGQFLTEI